MRLIGAGTREGYQYTVKETFLTAPNVITVLRFLLVPVFVVLVGEGSYIGALWVLVILGATDWVDGVVARVFDQISSVGMWLDPLADRVAVVIITFTLVYFELIPGWVLWVILVPDVLLFLTSALLFRGSPQLKVSPAGKVRTAGLMIAFPLTLLVAAEQVDLELLPLVAESVLIAACVLHVVASGDYLFQAWAKFRYLRRQHINPWDRHLWANPRPAAGGSAEVVGGVVPDADQPPTQAEQLSEDEQAVATEHGRAQAT
ncbi:CDP-alcohol phosphatidyltransferase family protein [Nesterenkonia alba]|uniref:CDP-alcohol phosphatidyltransferase family protein n=1 Tax=Nesterenkonia alba TaxID=515814 RepID=UPI0003B379BC|nr:CDP-alcohol phosphatidyltransferase family protein [Nesterenkonia alba]